MSNKPWLRIASALALALALGFMGCVTEDDEPLPPEDDGEQVQDDGPPATGELPEDWIPTDEEDTCGGARLKADGTCTAK